MILSVGDMLNPNPRSNLPRLGLRPRSRTTRPSPTTQMPQHPTPTLLTQSPPFQEQTVYDSSKQPKTFLGMYETNIQVDDISVYSFPCERTHNKTTPKGRGEVSVRNTYNSYKQSITCSHMYRTRKSIFWKSMNLFSREKCTKIRPRAITTETDRQTDRTLDNARFGLSYV